jgi:hypothetical protein
MAKYKVKWKNIFWNAGNIAMLFQEIFDVWPEPLKTELQNAAKTNPRINSIVSKLDLLFRNIVERKRKKRG